MQIRVYYEDTDANAIVYHTAYLKYCERARSEMFFKKGLSPLDGDNFFVVKSLNANFLGSAKLGDILEVKTSNKLFKRSFVILLQEIFLDDKLIFSMEVKIAHLHNGKVSRIPEELKPLLTYH